MFASRAVQKHTQDHTPSRAKQTSQDQTPGLGPPENVPEASPPLQRYLGNSYVQAMTAMGGETPQAPAVSPRDIYEREADRVADQVMAAPTRANISSAPLQIQRFSEPSPGQVDAAPASVGQALASPGRPLESVLRQDMEQRFGYHFSDVRVHTGAAAEQSARDVHARAYTMGHHIVFGAGRFAPGTTEGRRLIAHELTHVAQMSAFGSPPSLTAALGLPILRQPESGADADKEERRRRALSHLIQFENYLVETIGDDPPELIRWAEKQQIKFKDPQRTDEERRYLAQGLLRAFQKLGEFEGRAKRDPDDALVHSHKGQLVPWTQDRARKLDDIAPFTSASIAEWREAEAWQPPVTSRAKQPPKGKTPPPKQPAELPERHGFGVNVTFPKQEGMTFKTEEGQRRIAFLLISSTRSGYTVDQIEWAMSRIDLSKWWAPPSKLDLSTWQENFEAIPVGGEVIMGLSEKFTLELDSVLRDVPSRRAFQLAAYRQGVLDARGGMYLGYILGPGSLAAATLGAGAGTLMGLGLGTGAVGGGGLATGGGGLLAGGEGALLLGGMIRQGALSAGRYLYLNAPQLYADAMLYTGAIASGIALGEHLREVRSRGVRLSDLPRLVQDLMPFAGGYTEWRLSRVGGPQSLGEEPPGGGAVPAPIKPTPPPASVRPPTTPAVPGPKPIPVKVSGGAPPPAAPPAPGGPAGAAKESPILSFPRRDLIRGPFPAPPAGPTAPAPAQPVTSPPATGSVVAPVPVKPAAPVGPPTLMARLRGRLLNRWLAAAIEGAEPSLPKNIGAGGPSVAARSTPAVTAKAPTPSPAPTPAPPSVGGPPKIVRPPASSGPATTKGAVGTPASVTPAPSAATGRTGGTPTPAPKPAGKTPQALSAGTVVGTASAQMASAAAPQPTPTPEVAEAKATSGTVAQGTAFTHEQILDLFVRHFKRPGPPQGTIIFYQTEASFEAAVQAAGLPPGTFGFFTPASEELAATGEVAAMGSVHLPPTASALITMHESLHMISRQSGVIAILGQFVEEGLTEWLARSLGPQTIRGLYDQNVAFVKLLASIVGEDTLRDAYLHRKWEPLRSALRARLGSDLAVQHFYGLLRRVGPHGQRGGVLDDAIDMLWPASSGAPASATPTPPTTTRGSVGAQQINQMIDEEIEGLAQPGSMPVSAGASTPPRGSAVKQSGGARREEVGPTAQGEIGNVQIFANRIQADPEFRQAFVERLRLLGYTPRRAQEVAAAYELDYAQHRHPDALTQSALWRLFAELL
jgi:hypothetical protein